MVGARRSDAVMGLHAVENVAAASSGSQPGVGEVMPSPSAPAPNQRSSASAAGGGVHGEFGGRYQAVASGGRSVPGLDPLVLASWGVGRENRGQGDVADQPRFPGAKKWVVPSALSNDLLAGWG